MFQCLDLKNFAFCILANICEDSHFDNNTVKSRLFDIRLNDLFFIGRHFNEKKERV